jgi:hypothetical protein
MWQCVGSPHGRLSLVLEILASIADELPIARVVIEDRPGVVIVDLGAAALKLLRGHFSPRDDLYRPQKGDFARRVATCRTRLVFESGVGLVRRRIIEQDPK